MYLDQKLIGMKFEPMLFLWQFIVTVLAFLCIGSAMLNRKKRQKSLWLYTLYTTALLAYFLLVSPYDFAWKQFFAPKILDLLADFLQIIYSIIFFFFFLQFLDFKKHLTSFYKFIISTISLLFLTTVLGFVLLIFSNNNLLLQWFPLVVMLLVFCLFGFTFSKTFSHLEKNYNLFFLTASSVFIALILPLGFLGILDKKLFTENILLLFYLTIFLQQFFLSLALLYGNDWLNKKFLSNIGLTDFTTTSPNIFSTATGNLNNVMGQKEPKLSIQSNLGNEVNFNDPIYHLQLVSLQNQMNPHFIFNAINSIKVFLIENKKQEAIYYLNKFSKLIRHILGSTQIESISLAEEINILELYVSIENIRLEDKIELVISNPQKINLTTIMLPAMLLQPFIENAILHGLILKDQKKRIELLFLARENTISLKIRDNGVGREKSRKRRAEKTYQNESMGLKINMKRLAYFNRKYGVNYSFQLRDLQNKNGEAAGTEVELFFNY